MNVGFVEEKEFQKVTATVLEMFLMHVTCVVEAVPLPGIKI